MNSWRRQKTDEKETAQSATQPLATKSFVEEQTSIVPAPVNTGKDLVLSQPKANSHGLALVAEKECFLEWLSTCRAERRPQTQSELAEMLQVNVCTLSKWKRSPGFLAELVKRVRAKYADRLPGVIVSVASRAELGDIPASRLFLDFLGMSRRLEAAGEIEHTITLAQALKENGESSLLHQ
jgi:hypothetical protein